MGLHLVTGGSGFVGSNITRLLVARGERVRVLDLWKDEGLPAEVEFIRADINDRPALEAAIRGVDYVHHNVALVPLTKAGSGYWQVNVEGTALALDCARRAGVKLFSHMSSSAIFGSPDIMPITNDTPLNPIEIYGRAKAAADELVRQAGAAGPMKVTCIRPRTIIGRGRLGIFEILFDWIKDGANIYVIGSGDELFQFVHVEDLANVSIESCLQKVPGIFNVGTDRFGTLRQDLGAVIDAAGSRSRVKSLPVGLTIGTLTILDKLNLSPLGPWHYLTYHKPFYFDSASVTQALGWRPRYSNREMLVDAYRWFVENFKRTVVQTDASAHKSPVKQRILRLLKALS